MKAETKAILASVVVIALALTAVSGVTYSWWSDSESAEIDISTGGMDVTVTDMTVSESRTTMIDGTSSTETIAHNDLDTSSPGFQTSITEPKGDRATSVFTVSYKVTFTTTVDALYRIDFSVEGGDSWISGISVIDTTGPLGEKLGAWQDITSANSPMTLDITATFNADIDQSSYSNVTINTSNEIIQAEAITKWDGTTVTAITPKNNVYNGAQMAWIAQQVNAGTSFSGKTFTMMKDIYLDGKNWTPIGDVSHYFAGTFDGQENTIYDISCTVYDDGSNETAGLFGAITGTVKNVNVKGANITSSHYAGAICGYSTDSGSTIENCHVSDATITSKPNQPAGGTEYDNGDKVGGIIGYNASGDTVTGCSVRDSVLTAYRDIGGIVGATDKTTIRGNHVSNVTIVQDSTNGYQTGPITTVGEIYGRIVTSAQIENNTSSGVTIRMDTKAISYDDDSTLGSSLSENTALILNGHTLSNTNTIEAEGNLTVTGGTVLFPNTSSFGHFDLRPNAATENEYVFKDVTFTSEKKSKTYGPCTDRIESIIEFYPQVDGTTATFLFENCIFNNTMVVFEGSSDKTETYVATFRNCTFNNFGTSGAISENAYATGELTFENCTFNITATGSMTVLDTWYSKNEQNSTLILNNNTINGKAATAYTHDPSKNETEEDDIKIMNPSVEFYSVETEVQDSGTKVTGIATVNGQTI